MDSTIEDEVLEDFKKSLELIDFKGYDPQSTNFKNSINLGLMWKLIRELDFDEKTETHSEVVDNDEISDEIFGAKKYLQKYFDTNDSIYKSMAEDELNHARILIKKSNAKLPNLEEKLKLKKYEDEVKSVENQF